MGEYLAFALLIAALMLFLLSTKQFALWVRVFVIVAGLAALLAAGVITATMEGHYGLFRMVIDLWDNRGDLTQSVLAVAMGRNEASVDRHVLPLLDMFLILSGVLGVLAAIALTPGEAIEKTARPVSILIAGMMIGAALALCVVAIGFGGFVAPRSYAGVIELEDVYDGDTFWIGEASLRLYGVDAPERTQACRRDDRCGESARRHLATLLSGALVECTVQERRGGAAVKSFGRPLVTCEVRPDNGPAFDLGARLITAGHADIYERVHPEAYERLEFSAELPGAASDCWLNPRRWRNREDRAAFLAGSDDNTVGPACDAVRVAPAVEGAGGP